MWRFGAWSKVILVNLAVLAAAIVLVEVLLRILQPFDIIPTSIASTVGGASHIIYTQAHPGLKDQVQYTTNKFGFRSVSMTTRKKAPGMRRILCLGASTTQNSTQNTDEIWCSLLEKKLKAAGVTNVETAALGRGGWGVANILKWSRENAPEFEPDVVILLLGINDLAWSRSFDERTLAAAPDGFDIRQWCKNSLLVCRLAADGNREIRSYFDSNVPEQRIAWGLTHQPQRRRDFLSYPFVAEPVRSPDPMEGFAEGLDRIVSLFRKRGSEVIVLGQPVLWRSDLNSEEANVLWFSVKMGAGRVRADPGWMEREMRRYNARQKEIALAHDASFVDLDRLIPKDLTHYIDDCHYTDVGNEAVAEAVLPSLSAALSKASH
jgi:lysophospholipase L1-like esterase